MGKANTLNLKILITFKYADTTPPLMSVPPQLTEEWGYSHPHTREHTGLSYSDTSYCAGGKAIGTLGNKLGSQSWSSCPISGGQVLPSPHYSATGWCYYITALRCKSVLRVWESTHAHTFGLYSVWYKTHTEDIFAWFQCSKKEYRFSKTSPNSRRPTE